MKNNISPLASVHPNAIIGENVTIEPFSVVYEDVHIGDGTWIGPHTTIFQGARIGKNCQIHPGAVISNIPQDLKFKGEYTEAVIGDNTIIRECVTINRGTVDKLITKIGNECLLMAYVHVAHDCIIGDKCILANAVQLAGHVQIDYHTVVGGASAVHQFVKIGQHVMIGGGSLVRKDVPPYITASREPLRYDGVNTVGLRRRGYSNEQIHQIQEIYRILYSNGLNNSKALDVIEQTLVESDIRNEIITFIKSAERGIIRGN
ncbi:MAG TPA: acyl-[acyl-carrier-protein]--UDP-N-acetylglucosamine O-acyltransferase [Microscillaceae bacterium]|jgi:UDP-N-acetylglucosamine acyltransferase|nr:acyl-[acyl-carrier-protein]--UDP-N-acetylglucosamine O-acyltransferase [Microscillaceae bacterium]